MPDLSITSPANPRIKALVGLRRRRARDTAGETLVEGYEELALALATGIVPRAVYMCPELFSPPAYAGPSPIGGQDELVAAARDAGAQVVRLSRAVFEKVSYRQGPDGVLGVVAFGERGLDALTVPAQPLVLLVEGVEKPGNLGAMLRTADAAGADAVVALDAVTDWGNPNVVRASKGSVFAVPVASAPRHDALAWCHRHDIRLVVTTPQARLEHTQVDYTAGVAVVVGAEKHGVSERLLEAAAATVRIPMAGRANSLNVATAAAVVLYEAVRQRRSKRLQNPGRKGE
ncbi:MAG: TrmH family RNA methyltransferase [Dermatophilaceae bacterium]